MPGGRNRGTEEQNGRWQISRPGWLLEVYQLLPHVEISRLGIRTGHYSPTGLISKAVDVEARCEQIKALSAMPAGPAMIR